MDFRGLCVRWAFTKSREQKRQETVFFVCLGSGANAQFWQLQLPKLSAGIVRQTLPLH